MAGAKETAYRSTAIEAANWILASTKQTATGAEWPPDPLHPEINDDSLYAGTPGVVLFLLEAHHATGDKRYIDAARRGAVHLLSALPETKENGLYTGISGIGFVLEQTYRATHDRRYGDGVTRCVDLLAARAKRIGSGVQWGADADIDIIYGDAGIGLFLLASGDPRGKELAIAAGNRLVDRATRQGNLISWPTPPRTMPNFSHGTAGVAYFLATLFKATGDRRYLDAAIGAADYLISIAATDNDSCLILHDDEVGKNLYYLGWCHGPAGTARLFFRLYQATGDRKWLEWVRRSATAIMRSGIPGTATPGFWNNVSRCCGSAGVAEFFLDLYQHLHDRRYLTFSKEMTAQLLSKAVRDQSGTRWPQAEHRVKPDLIVAQTGLMQGAAGMGSWLLRLDSFQRRQKPFIVFPDSPF